MKKVKSNKSMKNKKKKIITPIYEYMGVKGSLKELCLRFGRLQDYSEIKYLICNCNFTVKQAFEHNIEKFYYKNETNTLKYFCNKYKMDNFYNYIRELIYFYEFNIGEAFDEVYNKIDYVLNNKNLTIMEICKYLHMEEEYKVIYKRVHELKWTLKDALIIKINKKKF